MLVAYGPDGQPVVAEERMGEQLQQWSRERLLYCPNCRGIVHVRGGAEKRMQLHFAHQRGECAWSTEAESVRHAEGKRILAQWLQAQFADATVTLEERLPEPNRIADIFVVHADGRRWAIEFQCASLDVEEWKLRHEAYRKAGILDVWIIGVNRRDKQEAFIEAIFTTANAVLFLDPQVTPPRIWLRWMIDRTVAQEWQQINQHTTHPPSLDGWVGRTGYGATLIGQLYEVSLDAQGALIHPARTTVEARIQLLRTMQMATTLDETLLATYLRPGIREEALRVVLLPLVRAYLRDPDLLRRYNYGRGQLNQEVSAADRQRIQQAQQWLHTLTRRGFTREDIRALLQDIPYVGPYAAFIKYAETLTHL
jgi:hypothetical protein